MPELHLTERERFVLRGLAAGMSRQQIARSLDRSRATVDYVVLALQEKFGARSAAHIVDRAWRLGLLAREAA